MNSQCRHFRLGHDHRSDHVSMLLKSSVHSLARLALQHPNFLISTLIRPSPTAPFARDSNPSSYQQHVTAIVQSAMPSRALPSMRTFVTHLLNSLPAANSVSAINASAAAAPTHPLNSVPDHAKKQLLTLHVLFPNELLPALDLLDRRLVTRFRICRNLRKTEEEAKDVMFTNPFWGAQNAQHNVARTVSEAAGELDEPSAPNSSTDTVGHMDPSDVEMADEGFEASSVDAEDGTHLRRIVDEDEDIAQQEEILEKEDQDQDTIYYVRSAQQKSSRYSISYDSTSSYEVRLKAWNCSCPAFAFAAFPSVHPEPPVPELVNYHPRGGDEDVGFGDQDDGWRFGGHSLEDGMPPVCKHLLACVLVERCEIFRGFMEEKEVSVEEAAGWAAGWGD
ncbi:hypothetical protein CC78DRAFT_615414 [Lojkania enalia]|uniref:SWIM-type domain-containing protein n=1 Tax=Lojkania enalia TaxID=147567 RepID=A0A9P4KCH1_9PLEO|nr:hypothetical protein CC78DRAFT_615414 [Didymosphaeria enalia]